MKRSIGVLGMISIRELSRIVLCALPDEPVPNFTHLILHNHQRRNGRRCYTVIFTFQKIPINLLFTAMTHT